MFGMIGESLCLTPLGQSCLCLNTCLTSGSTIWLILILVVDENLWLESVLAHGMWRSFWVSHCTTHCLRIGLFGILRLQVSSPYVRHITWWRVRERKGLHPEELKILRRIMWSLDVPPRSRLFGWCLCLAALPIRAERDRVPGLILWTRSRLGPQPDTRLPSFFWIF